MNTHKQNLNKFIKKNIAIHNTLCNNFRTIKRDIFKMKKMMKKVIDKKIKNDTNNSIEIEEFIKFIIKIIEENEGTIGYKYLLKIIQSKINGDIIHNLLSKYIKYKKRKLLHFLKLYPNLFHIYGKRKRAKYIKYLYYYSDNDLVSDTDSDTDNDTDSDTESEISYSDDFESVSESENINDFEMI